MNTRSGFGTTARARIVPVRGSTWLSTKSTRARVRVAGLVREADAHRVARFAALAACARARCSAGRSARRPRSRRARDRARPASSAASRRPARGCRRSRAARPARPSIGARTSVNSRSSRARSTAASAARTPALPCGGRGACARRTPRARSPCASTSVCARASCGTRQLRLAARALEFRLGAIERGAVAALVDHEQQVALAHLLAFLECDALDVAADARPQLDGLDRGDATGELVPLPDVARHDLRDAHVRRRRHVFRRRRLLAAETLAEADYDAAGQSHDGEHNSKAGE